jgi:hypothetical protein
MNNDTWKSFEMMNIVSRNQKVEMPTYTRLRGEEEAIPDFFHRNMRNIQASSNFPSNFTAQMLHIT